MLKLVTQSVDKAAGDLFVVPVMEDHALYQNPAINALVRAATDTGDFKGKKKDALMLYGTAGVRFKRVLFLGLGPADKLTAEDLRAAAGAAVKRAMDAELASAVFAVGSAPAHLDPVRYFDALAEGAALANHVIDRYKEKRPSTPLKQVGLLAEDGDVNMLRRRLQRLNVVTDATRRAREWVSIPSNDKLPKTLADMIAAPARKAGLKVTVMTEKALTTKGFGAVMAVGQGSQHPPRLLVLDYAPKAYKKTIALVGKGVTFDSGGISLKPASGMDDMKSDMAGAAAVAATLMAAAALKPKQRVVGIMPLVENMPSGSALRPGDIIRTFSGKTVEIGNTDAEGRLILADALAWGIKTYRPDVIVDLATLTGACVVALGEKIAAVFTPEDDLAQALLDAGTATGERLWRMPLPEDYAELMKSEIADISNMSSARWGGAITAAMFLKSFVGDARWAHLDIAGPAYSKKASPYGPAGGTGFGVRLLCEVLEKLA